MLFVVTPLLLMIALAIIAGRNGDASFSSDEYREMRERQENMNLKKIFGRSAEKKTDDVFSVENVMEYLRQEGFRPELDSDDALVVRFKYQGQNITIAVVGNFCRFSSWWKLEREETNVEAIHAAAMKVMDDYRYIRIIYVGDVLEFAVDQTITSFNHFNEVFALSLFVICECEQLHRQEYNKLIGFEDLENRSRRHDIYQPEFRWLPDVVFRAVTNGRLSPEALTDEEWLRQQIQNGIADAEYIKEWKSFRINRVENYGDYKLIVYQFPEPKVVPEAKYGAALLNRKTLEIDYYTLEMTFDNKWVYGNMSTERHNNYGEVDTSDLDKFIEWIFSKDKQIVACNDYTKEKQETVN